MSKFRNLIKESDIIYKLPNFWVLRVKTGFEVLKTGIANSTRVAQIGYTGQIGIDKAITECQKLQNNLTDEIKCTRS